MTLPHLPGKAVYRHLQQNHSVTITLHCHHGTPLMALAIAEQGRRDPFVRSRRLESQVVYSALTVHTSFSLINHFELPERDPPTAQGLHLCEVRLVL